MDSEKSDLLAARTPAGAAAKRVLLAELVADRLLERATQADLERVFWNAQLEWAEAVEDEELIETAQRLGIDNEQ